MDGIGIMQRDIADAKDLLSRVGQVKLLLSRMKYEEECIDLRRDTLDSVITLAENDLRHTIAFWEKSLEEMHENERWQSQTVRAAGSISERKGARDCCLLP